MQGRRVASKLGSFRGCCIMQIEDLSARGHREWKLDNGGKFER